MGRQRSPVLTAAICRRGCRTKQDYAGSRSRLNSRLCAAKNLGFPPYPQKRTLILEVVLMSAMLALYSVERVVAPPRFALALIRSALLLIAMACVGCATVNQLAAASPADQAQKVDPMLSAAGFKQLPASTPQQMERLKSLPPLKLGYYVDDNGGANYCLGDPDNWRRLFRGGELAGPRDGKVKR